MRKALLFLVILPVVLLLAVTPTHAASLTAGVVLIHPAGALPAQGSGAQTSAIEPVYDEQLGMTFAQSFTALSYNVTAVPQSDAQGFGPAYILNGLTNDGYWYQVGVAFDWPYKGGGYDAGFNFLYEVFNSSGSSVFPSGGGGGLNSFTGQVRGGDPVLLKLSFSAGQLVFTARDWSTGATATESFTAVGDRFVGLRSSSGANGFFTGLMTEWYHVSLYYGSEAEVTYSNPGVQLTSATLWADEFNSNDSSSVFGYSQSYAFSDPYQFRQLSGDGATEYANAFSFITGSLGRTALTLSYSVAGGGGGFGAPVLGYTANGTYQSATLSETPTTFYADNGSLWQVSLSLPGGSSTQRWETSQVTNGTLTGPLSESIVYYHQYLLSFSYTVVGGGSGYSPPEARTTEFGSTLTLDGNASAWVDSGATLQHPSSLAGSTPSERWSSMNSSLTIDGPEDAVVTYYHQVSIAFGYELFGGGSPTPPTLAGTSFGSPFSSPISNSSGYFLDEGTAWSLSSVLTGGGTGERWFAPDGTNGSAITPGSVAVAYSHQYLLSVGSPEGEGGSVSPQPSWVDSGSNVTLSAATNSGWEFRGWVGSGGGSYSGPLDDASVLVSGPIEENATFYPGLTIGAGPDGEISFTAATANGTVPAGGSMTIYAPPGSTVALKASPSSILYSFAGWNPSSSSGASLTLLLSSPGSVGASFHYNLLTLAALSVLSAGAGVAAILLARRRGATMTPSPRL